MQRVILISLVCAVAHGFRNSPPVIPSRNRVIANGWFSNVAPPERDAVIFTSSVGIVDPTTVSRASPEKAAEVLREWLSEWVKAWEAEGSGLTTPIEVKPTDDGARLVWKPKESNYLRKEDKARQKEERWAQKNSDDPDSGLVDVLRASALLGGAPPPRRRRAPQVAPLRSPSEPPADPRSGGDDEQGQEAPREDGTIDPQELTAAMKPRREKKTGGLDFRVLQPYVGVEVARCEYEEGVIVKAMSEKTIIDRLKRDLKIYEKAVKNSSA